MRISLKVSEIQKSSGKILNMIFNRTYILCFQIYLQESGLKVAKCHKNVINRKGFGEVKDCRRKTQKINYFLKCHISPTAEWT